MATRWRSVQTQEAKVVVGAVEGFGLAAHHFALRFEVARQAVQKSQLGAWHGGFGHAGGMRKVRVIEPLRGDHIVELVVAQVGGNRHLFQTGVAARDGQGVGIELHIQRQGGTGAPFLQGVVLHHGIGQHGDFVARHVNGGQALPADLIDGVTRLQRQARRGDVDAHRDVGAAQALHRQGVVDLGGLRVVDGIGLHVGQWQIVRGAGRLQRWKLGALGKVVKQKPLPVKLVGRGDGPSALQQGQRGQLGGAGGLHHGFVLGPVFVGFEENFVQLRQYRLGALAVSQGQGPGIDLRQLLFFLVDRHQGLLDHFGGGFFEASSPSAAKVMRGFKQAQQGGGLLDQAGVGAEVLARQVDKAKFLWWGEFPGQVQLDGWGQGAGLAHQIGGAGFVKLDQNLGRLHFDAFARVELDLGGSFSLGQDATGQKFSGIFKQCIHARIVPCPHATMGFKAWRCPSPGRWSNWANAHRNRSSRGQSRG